MLRHDPLPPLLTSGNTALAYLTRRDVVGVDSIVGRAGDLGLDPVDKALWALPEVARIVRRQQDNGAWRYPGADEKQHIRAREDYDQLETYRQLGVLVEKYGLTRSHPVIDEAAAFLFGCQSDEGDFRGIYGSQYSPNYSAGISELLLKAGFDDERIDRQMDWLLSLRQDDGGWAIPFRTGAGSNGKAAPKWTDVLRAPKVAPNRSKPSSHLVTGVVLRAFAAHPRYRTREEARVAGELLASRLFTRDRYPDRRGPEYWTRFAFPFWFTDLLSALDSLHGLGFTLDHPLAGPQIGKVLQWFVDRQASDGLWDVKLLKKAADDRRWIGYVIARTFKRYLSG